VDHDLLFSVFDKKVDALLRIFKMSQKLLLNCPKANTLAKEIHRI